VVVRATTPTVMHSGDIDQMPLPELVTATFVAASGAIVVDLSKDHGSRLGLHGPDTACNHLPAPSVRDAPDSAGGFARPARIQTITTGYQAITSDQGAATVIVLGVVLLIIGFIAKIAIIWTIGIIAVVVGAVLAIAGATGRSIGGRKHYY
jgi:hypothetical protein